MKAWKFIGGVSEATKLISINKGSQLTAIEMKNGKVKNVGGSFVFKQIYPEALSLIVGSTK